MAELSYDVVLLRDASLRQILYVNPSYERIFHAKKSKLYKNPETWFDAISSSDHGRLTPARIKQTIDKGEEFTAVYSITALKDKLCWLREHAYGVFDDKDNC